MTEALREETPPLPVHLDFSRAETGAWVPTVGVGRLLLESMKG